jgi:hypothetical protein
LIQNKIEVSGLKISDHKVDNNLLVPPQENNSSKEKELSDNFMETLSALRASEKQYKD